MADVPTAGLGALMTDASECCAHSLWVIWSSIHSVFPVEGSTLHSVSRTRKIERNSGAIRHKRAWIGPILHLNLDAARSSFSLDYVTDVTMPWSLGACC